MHNNKKIRNIITIKNLKLIWEVRAVPRGCVLYLGICLTTEEKAWQNHSWVAARTSQADTIVYLVT
jgi:hypothetical protein